MIPADIVEAVDALMATHYSPRRREARDRLLAAIGKLYMDGYLDGFNASSQGWNGEYPFGDNNESPEDDSHWREKRDEAYAARAQAGAQGEGR
jgi:hypothetical protein